jgi:archaellum component FlaC
MSRIIQELATINVSDDIINGLDLDGIYQSFSKNYRKLDDLKKFRSEHEQRNALMQWWHSDKLQNAQLNSAEVQAEFSKTIGQLMMISIMQSKKLTEQQSQLNDQQGILKTQADGIWTQAAKLQQQHQVLSQQSADLERLVKDYFALKGLTEQGAQRLIEIAAEIRSTKQSMLDEFAGRTQQVEAVCTAVTDELSVLKGSVAQRNAELEQKMLDATQAVRVDMLRHIDSIDSARASMEQRLSQVDGACDGLTRRLDQIWREGRENIAEQSRMLTAVENDVKRLSAIVDDSNHASAMAKRNLDEFILGQLKVNDQTTLLLQQAEDKLRKMGVVFKALSLSVVGLMAGVGFLLATR